MKLIEAIEDNSVIVKANNRALRIQPDAFQKMWTMNSADRRVNNAKLVEEIANQWQDTLGAAATVSLTNVYIDSLTLTQIDNVQRQVNKLTINDFLKVELEEVGVQRAIVSLQAKGMHTGISPTLAITIAEQGESFAFGETVHICQNFNVLNADNYFQVGKKSPSLKGTNKWDISSIMAFLRTEVFPKTERFFEKDLELVAKMAQETISREQYLLFIAQLYEKIEYINALRLNKSIKGKTPEEKFLPLTSRQLAQIVVEAKEPSHTEYAWQEDSTTLWNLINYGTEHIKFERGADLPTVLQANKNWIDTVRSHAFAPTKSIQLLHSA